MSDQRQFKSNQSAEKKAPETREEKPLISGGLSSFQRKVTAMQSTLGNQATIRRLAAEGHIQRQTGGLLTDGTEIDGAIMTADLVDAPTVMTAMGPAEMMPGPLQIANLSISNAVTETPPPMAEFIADEEEDSAAPETSAAPVQGANVPII